MSSLMYTVIPRSTPGGAYRSSRISSALPGHTVLVSREWERTTSSLMPLRTRSAMNLSIHAGPGTSINSCIDRMPSRSLERHSRCAHMARWMPSTPSWNLTRGFRGLLLNSERSSGTRSLSMTRVCSQSRISTPGSLGTTCLTPSSLLI